MASADLTPDVFDITLYRGDATDFRLDISEDGGPLELPTTGWRGQIRTSRSSADVTATIDINADDAGNGVVRLDFPTLDPGRYVYDVECVDTGRTYVQGTLHVRWDVTRAD